MENKRYKWGLGGFMAVAAYFLLTEHRAHVVAFLPYALLLACPLMHLFMHHDHGGQHDHSQHRVHRQDEQGDD